MYQASLCTVFKHPPAAQAVLNTTREQQQAPCVSEAACASQVEAATGGEDVVRFCGGLKAVLGVAGIPLHKALPCPEASQAEITGSLQPILQGEAAPVHDVPLNSSNGLPGSTCDEKLQQSNVDQGQCMPGKGQVGCGIEQGADFSQKDQVGAG